MANATATVTHVLSNEAIARARKLADKDHGLYVNALTDWSPQAMDCTPDKRKADKELVSQSRTAYVLQRCIKGGFTVELNSKGQVALTVAAVAAISKVDADKFVELKNRARNAHDKGVSEALAELAKQHGGYETWKEAKTPKTPGTPPAIEPATPDEEGETDVTGIPPSIIAGIEQVRDAILHFQTTQKLTKDAKEAIGKLAEMTQALLDKANGATPPAK